MTEEYVPGIAHNSLSKVKDYIEKSRKEGKLTMNITEAAKELDLTVPQVIHAYETLVKSGYFEDEWEIEILACIKGTEKAKEAICEVHATLLNYPLTYIDTKLTKPELQKALEPLKDIEKKSGDEERHTCQLKKTTKQ